MTALLASVNGPEEARIALAAGADIIDLKDPETGALGALPLPVIETTVRTIDGRRTISATVGDLPADPEMLSSAVKNVDATGVDYVKVGFFSNDKLDPCLDALGNRARGGARLVAVLFADLNPDPKLIDALANCGFTGVMLDTADKRTGGLLNHITERQLENFVRLAKNRNLLTGLAGSLSVNDIPALLPLEPDYLGFRTALCDRRQRTAGIDENAVLSVRSHIPKITSIDLPTQTT